MGGIRQWYQLHQPSISIQNFVITGILGTVYIKAHNGNLYVGTNQGLFYKKYPD
jgi:hypothetical protein